MRRSPGGWGWSPRRCAVRAKREAEDGTIRSALNTSKCLDLASSNTSNGNNIVVHDCHNGGNQRWIVDGPVLRSALKRSKVFDVSGGNTANGTRIQIWDDNGGGGQQWTQVRR
ncbi:MAG: RICIN domain-containing protein [Myxococcaceae bacterium]|nr:RICIN domain-containing protein [Myxococcaceae bacterium]